jgi:ZIP family zinc transporter
VRCRFHGEGSNPNPRTICFGVAVDLFSDGIKIGLSATVVTGFAFLLALGQVPGIISEGLATIAAFP